ncbi:DgyrCDS13230 [Dimorphilus gyrociliatus]|uniref:DgyrCDS13230 n=1 Tax=Dimorphilus gyrociliatus TaxID=2664684 RepID=A0A7I8WA22_9ANNE|nr:DgyrCDS13230 [Dimorphilus gyrociliatus]
MISLYRKLLYSIIVLLFVTSLSISLLMTFMHEKLLKTGYISSKAETSSVAGFKLTDKIELNKINKKYEESCGRFLKDIQILDSCPCLSNKLVGRRKALVVPRNWSDIEIAFKGTLQTNGEFRPHCNKWQTIAIIIPFMKREMHLRLFIDHIHPILQAQQIHYRIFVIEQNQPNIFNKGTLMNSGYLEAKKHFQFDCVIFHDVDMLSEDDRNIYNCIDSPRHIGSHVDIFQYRLFYDKLVGGALAFEIKEFENINGYSTKFFGWGGEDDDMYNRLFYKGLKITRYDEQFSKFRMIQHNRDAQNPNNIYKFNSFYPNPSHYNTDGLSSTYYKVVSVKEGPLFTSIKLNLEVAQNTEYTNEEFEISRKPIERNTSVENEEQCAVDCYRKPICYGYNFMGKKCYLWSNHILNSTKTQFKTLKRKIANEQLLLVDYQRFDGLCKGESSIYRQMSPTECSRTCKNDATCRLFSYNYNEDAVEPCLKIDNSNCSKSNLHKLDNIFTYFKKNLNKVRFNDVNFSIKNGDCFQEDIASIRDFPADECSGEKKKNSRPLKI